MLTLRVIMAVTNPKTMTSICCGSLCFLMDQSCEPNYSGDKLHYHCRGNSVRWKLLEPAGTSYPEAPRARCPALQPPPHVQGRSLLPPVHLSVQLNPTFLPLLLLLKSRCYPHLAIVCQSNQTAQRMNEFATLSNFFSCSLLKWT